MAAVHGVAIKQTGWHLTAETTLDSTRALKQSRDSARNFRKALRLGPLAEAVEAGTAVPR